MSSEIPSSTTRERPSFGDAQEAEEFVQMLAKFERGELSSEQYRQYRLTRGIYGQRQDDVHMVRVKIPQGVLSAQQLRVLADLGEQYSRGYGHVTTRQNVQFHDVKPHDVSKMMAAIADAGLTTREACSHAVRNVTGCPYAGVCGGAPFDVTPYAEAVTRNFLRGPLGSGLPRKFKINVSGCGDDCAQGAMNDIGIIAQQRDGQRGFRILAGGGTATLPRSGGVLHDFLPEVDLLRACESIVRVFNVEGERNNIKKARMKWAIQRLGWEGFKAKYEVELAKARAEQSAPLPTIAPDEQPPVHEPRARNGKPLPTRFTTWRSRHVRAQSQAGYSTALVWLRLGDISGVQLRAVADLSEQLGDGSVRLTNTQNLLFRWVRDEELGELWLALDAIGLGEPFAEDVSDVVSCPGAETCRIAVTASRGVAQLVGDKLRVHGEPRVDGPDIKVSGCPNGCGQHHVGAIGLQGGTRRVGDRLVPQYFVFIGGGIDARGAKFGRLVGKVPARRVPEAIDRLITKFDSSRAPGETARAFFQRLEVPEAKALLADLFEFNEATATADDYRDLGSSVDFKVVELEGECAS